MKHLKAYKIFENENTQTNLEEICESIEDILLPLTDDKIKVIAKPEYKDKDYIYLHVKKNDIFADSFNLNNYINEFKQLFSYLESEDLIIDSEPKIFYGEDDKTKYSNIFTEHPELHCYKCESESVDIIDDDDLAKCENCGEESHIDDFIKHRFNIEDYSDFFREIKNREIESIFFRLIKSDDI